MASLAQCGQGLEAQTWSFEVQSDPIPIDPIGTVKDVVVSTVGDVAGNAVTGWQLSFAYDENQVSIFGLQPLTITTPSFFNTFYANTPTVVQGVTFGPGVGRAVCLYDFGLVNTLPTDTLTPILLVQVTSGAGPIPGSASIDFLNGIPMPGGADPVNQLGWNSATVVNGGYDIPDFPGALLLFEFPTFTRGDVNNDALVNLVDVIALLEWAFLGTYTPPCIATVDIYADGEVQAIRSAIELLQYLFAGAALPSGGVCTPQNDLGLTCDSSACP